MRMSDFEDLPLHRQLTMLYQQGIYIGKSKQEELTRLLFQLEYFYIAVESLQWPLAPCQKTCLVWTLVSFRNE